MRSPFTQSQRTGYYATAFAFMLALIFNATPPAHAQTETALYSFANHADGGAPNGAAIIDWIVEVAASAEPGSPSIWLISTPLPS